MARSRLVVEGVVREGTTDDSSGEPSVAASPLVSARASLTCTAADRPRPRWPRPRIAPPPVLQ